MLLVSGRPWSFLSLPYIHFLVCDCVPFELGRGDIVNFPRIDDERIAEFVAQQPRSILVIQDRFTTAELKSQLPPGTILRCLGRRGMTNMVEALTPSPTGRVAGSLDGTRRQ